MELKFKFGIDFELKRIKYTLAKLGWYNSHGYKPRLPEGINKESNEKEIKSQIAREFNEKRHKEVANKIYSDFSKIKKQLHEKLKKINKDIPAVFSVCLTSYGTGGSYSLPNIIICSINSKKSLKIIVHEIIHLLIESRIKRYEIKHWEKERIVDLILNSKDFNFLEYSHWQGNCNNAEKYIDELFNNCFYKNPEDFFRKIKMARHKNV